MVVVVVVGDVGSSSWWSSVTWGSSSWWSSVTWGSSSWWSLVNLGMVVVVWSSVTWDGRRRGGRR